LPNLAIPASLTNIGYQAFALCTNLSAFTVAAGNPAYSSAAGVLFDQTQSALIQYPQNKAGGAYAIPAGVASLGGWAFRDCLSLTQVTIPDSVTSLGELAFYGCSFLTNVVVGNSVTSIGSYAFAGCYRLPSLTFPLSLISMGDHAFDSCQSLTNFTIPTHVTSIGSYAFSSCNSLPSVTIPNSVTNLGEGAFSSCRVTNVALPAGLTRISDKLFADSWLKSLTVPTTVVSIGAYAFEKCPLISFVMPASVTNIGVGAFYNCMTLTNVTILAGDTSLADTVFIQCYWLTSVFFKGNAPSLGGSLVFDGDNYVTVYYLPGTTGWTNKLANRPTALWNPLAQTSGPNFGVGIKGFGFNITGTTNIPIVVEASPNLASGPWISLQSLSLTNGAFHFSDPDWTNYPARLYRIRSP